MSIPNFANTDKFKIITYKAENKFITLMKSNYFYRNEMISGLYIHGMKDGYSKSIFLAVLIVYVNNFVKEMKHFFL